MLAQVEAGLAARAGSRGEHSLAPAPAPFTASLRSTRDRSLHRRRRTRPRPWDREPLAPGRAAGGVGRDGRLAAGRGRPRGDPARPRPSRRRRPWPCERADGDDPWARWWRVLAAGQSAGAGGPGRGPGRRAARRRPRGRTAGRWPGGSRTCAAELAALAGGDGGPRRRFAILGHRARPASAGCCWPAARRRRSSSSRAGSRCAWCAWRPRRGRRSATAPTRRLLEVIAADPARRGRPGLGRCPATRPHDLDPEAMLGALREDPASPRPAPDPPGAGGRRGARAARRGAGGPGRGARLDRRRARPPAAACGPAPPRRPPATAEVAVPRSDGEAAALLGLERGRRAGRGGPRLPRPGVALPPRPGGRPAPGDPGPGRGAHRGAERGARPAARPRRRAAGLSAPAGSAARASAARGPPAAPARRAIAAADSTSIPSGMVAA